MTSNNVAKMCITFAPDLENCKIMNSITWQYL